MKIINLISNIPLYTASRKFGTLPPYPFNITLSITNKCNSKCKTCNIWKKSEFKELTTKEWEKILGSIGNSSFWITVSGGEPFLREDITDIIKIIEKYNKPKIITIPTNGILTKKIIKNVKEILKIYSGELIINISIDDIGKKHDNIRGIECFDNALSTFKQLKKINEKRLTVGIHTVVSRYNINNFKSIYSFIKNLSSDSYIVEIAEKRKELENINKNIEPNEDDYFKVINFLMEEKRKRKGISKITEIMRKDYYKKTKSILEDKKQKTKCYAGIASIHIKSDGNVVACCIKEESLGNLRKNNFKEIWNSKKADKIRRNIKKRECFCTLANVYYSNMICDIV